MPENIAVDFMIPPPDAELAPSGPVWLSEDGIVITIGKSESQDTDIARENMLYTKKVTGGKPRPLLVDITKVRSMSKGAREEYVKQQEELIITAVALLTRSGVGKMIGNIFISLNKPNVPVKLFTDPGKAYEWLMGHRIS